MAKKKAASKGKMKQSTKKKTLEERLLSPHVSAHIDMMRGWFDEAGLEIEDGDLEAMVMQNPDMLELLEDSDPSSMPLRNLLEQSFRAVLTPFRKALVQAEQSEGGLVELYRLYKRAVELGREELGAECFAEDVGAFGTFEDGLAFVNTLAEAAEAAAAIGHLDEAIEGLQEALQLAPEDPFGWRKQLAAHLMLAGRDEEAAEMFRQRRGLREPGWLYLAALSAFRCGMERKERDWLLAKALDADSMIADAILARSGMDDVGSLWEARIEEDEDFAQQIYANTSVWRRTLAACEWLHDQLAEFDAINGHLL